MDRASLPFLFVASPAIRGALGKNLGPVAVMAMQALLRNGKGLEVALQQISYGKLPIAFSSRVGRYGDLIIELDIGDPTLADRIFLERDLRRAAGEASRARIVLSRQR